MKNKFTNKGTPIIVSAVKYHPSKIDGKPLNQLEIIFYKVQ